MSVQQDGREIFYQRLQADKVEVQKQVTAWLNDFTPALAKFRTDIERAAKNSLTIDPIKHTFQPSRLGATGLIKVTDANVPTYLTKFATAQLTGLYRQLFKQDMAAITSARTLLTKKISNHPEKLGLQGHVSSLEKFMRKIADGTMRSQAAKDQKAAGGKATPVKVEEPPTLAAPQKPQEPAPAPRASLLDRQERLAALERAAKRASAATPSTPIKEVIPVVQAPAAAGIAFNISSDFAERGREIFYNRLQASDRQAVLQELSQWDAAFVKDLSVCRSRMDSGYIFDPKTCTFSSESAASTTVKITPAQKGRDLANFTLFQLNPLLRRLFPNGSDADCVASFLLLKKIKPNTPERLGEMAFDSPFAKFIRKAKLGYLKSVAQKETAYRQKQADKDAAAKKIEDAAKAAKIQLERDGKVQVAASDYQAAKKLLVRLEKFGPGLSLMKYDFDYQHLTKQIDLHITGSKIPKNVAYLKEVKLEIDRAHRGVILIPRLTVQLIVPIHDPDLQSFIDKLHDVSNEVSGCQAKAEEQITIMKDRLKVVFQIDPANLLIKELAPLHRRPKPTLPIVQEELPKASTAPVTPIAEPAPVVPIAQPAPIVPIAQPAPAAPLPRTLHGRVTCCSRFKRWISSCCKVIGICFKKLFRCKP